MVNETIVRIALALGISPTIVAMFLAFVSGSLLTLAGERFAIAQKAFKPPTPDRARDTAYVLGAASILPMAVFLGVGFQTLGIVGGAVGLFFGLQYLRGDVPFNREE